MVCLSGGASSKRGPRIVNGILIGIRARGDVERRARTGNHERAQTKPARQSNRAPKEYSVTYVETRAAIILLQVIGIRRKLRDSKNVAVRIIQGVVTKQRKSCAYAHAAIDDQLVLLECAFGLILKQILVNAVRSHAGNGIGGIQVVRVENVNSPGV